RAAFKLAEIDDKFHLLKPGAKVVDLGAAPGGWSQIAAQRVGAVDGRPHVEGRQPTPAGREGVTIVQPPACPPPHAEEGKGGGDPTPDCLRPSDPLPAGEGGYMRNPAPQEGGEHLAASSRPKPASTKGRVVAIDLLDMPAIPGVEFLHLDFLDEAAPDRLKALLGGPADVVLSDMAANATGHRKTDHLRIMALAETAAMFAREVLRLGGAFLCKVLQGGTEAELLAALNRDFATVKHVKPAASRPDSAELYVLALGFQGAGDRTGPSG